MPQQRCPKYDHSRFMKELWKDEEYRRKQHETHVGKPSGFKGHKHTEEAKQKSREARQGRKASVAARRKISEAGKGRKQSPEHIRKRFESRAGWHHTEESKQKISLAKGGTGIPGETGDYSKEFYEVHDSILERDGYECQLCHSAEDLCVHHIDYDKQNSDPANLITLDRTCNIRVNAERIFYQGLFEFAYRTGAIMHYTERT